MDTVKTASSYRADTSFAKGVDGELSILFQKIEIRRDVIITQ